MGHFGLELESLKVRDQSWQTHSITGPQKQNTSPSNQQVISPTENPSPETPASQTLPKQSTPSPHTAFPQTPPQPNPSPQTPSLQTPPLQIPVTQTSSPQTLPPLSAPTSNVIQDTQSPHRYFTHNRAHGFIPPVSQRKEI